MEGIWGEVILTIQTFFNAKKNSLNIENTWPVTTEFEVRVKMEQEPLGTIKFLLGYNLKIFV